MSNDLKTLMEYIGNRWKSTEPGLKWAYILSIIAAILFVPYSPGPYLFVELLLIPITICAFIQGGLRLRLLWLGLLLFNIEQIFNLVIHYNYVFGIRLNDYIAFPIVIIALIRGFLSFDLKKTGEMFIQRCQLAVLLAIFLFIIIAHLSDLLLPLYGNFKNFNYFDYIITITGISSILPTTVYIIVYVLLIISILIKDHFGIIFSFILLISDTFNWIAFLFLRIYSGLFYFFDEFITFRTELKCIYILRFSLALILPVLSTTVIILFQKKIQDPVFIRKTYYGK